MGMVKRFMHASFLSGPVLWIVEGLTAIASWHD
jgi:hypothetical protein